MKRRRICGLLVTLGACSDGGSARPDAPDEALPRQVTLNIGSTPDPSFAFQDGDGPWQLIPPQATNIVTLTVRAERYAVARLCRGAEFIDVAYQASTEDRLDFPCNPLDQSPTSKLAGTITSNPNDAHIVTHGSATRFESDASTSFSYELPTTGTSDLVVMRQPIGDAIDVLHVERDVSVTGTVTRDFDFSTLEAPMTIEQPVPGNEGASYIAFIPNGVVGPSLIDVTEPFVHAALPVAARRATDRYDVGVVVDLEFDSTVQFDAILADPTAVTAPTRNLLEPLDVTQGTTLSIGWITPAGASSSGFIGDDDGIAFASFSTAWEASFPGAPVFQVPDLSTVEGWPALGALRSPANQVTITAVVEQGSYPADGYQAEVFQRSFFATQQVRKPVRTLERLRWRHGDSLD